MLGTILRNKNNVEEKQNGIRALPRSCPELLDASSERTMSDTDAAQNTRCYLSRIMFCKEANIQGNDQPNGVIREYTFASTPFMIAWSVHGSLQSDRELLRTKAYLDVENELNVATTS